MKEYKYIMFDLDGTLINSEDGIINAFRYALNYFNLETEKEELRKFIGPPLKDTFMEYYKFDKEKATLAVAKYREYYSEQGFKENTLYNGIEKLLVDLKEKDKILIIATSKPTIFTEKILKIHNIKQYFEFISGATLDNKLSKKADIIRHAIQSMDIKDLDKCIMVGDKFHDVIGAKLNNIDVIGVTYGFGSKEELKKEGATYIVDKVEKIEEMLLK